MTINFSAYPDANDAMKARTEEFFENIRNNIDSDAVLLKLVHEGICLEARDDSGKTALLRAAHRHQINTVQALLAAGANIEARDNYGNTVLIGAAVQGRTETIKTLFEAGANIAAKDDIDRTALEWAFVTGRDNVKDLLSSLERHQSYANFIENGAAPKSAAEVYHLLAVTPLVDPRAPVDFVGNIRKIFAHAHWADKEQAADVLTQMQNDGRINAETVDSILDNTFIERSHASCLQPRGQGIAL